MSDIAIPAVGFLTFALGVVFLIGCFVRVDSAGFLDRTDGNPEKIRKLQTLQDGWSKLGKLRQFVASSLALLILGVGLLAVWQNPSLGRFVWVVPALLALDLAAVLLVRRHAMRVLNSELPGHQEILKVLKQNIRMCISFSVVFVVLVARA